jgi:tetratricopeptide (TPR) repeat protein
VKSVVLLLPLLAGTLFAEDPRVAALIQQGDAADAIHDARGALTAFEQADQLQPRNFGILLRISKQYADLAGSTKNSLEAKAFVDKAVEFGRRAVALDPRSAKAHLNLAVSYGKLTDFVGNKQKVEFARTIHDEAQLSLALDSADDYAWHVLGRWNAEVANLNSVLRAVANYVYGGLPPASNEEAVRCFRKAVELAPQRILHHAELAKVYTRISKPEAAAQEWQNVVGLKTDGAADEQYQRDAKLALNQFRQARSGTTRGVARR